MLEVDPNIRIGAVYDANFLPQLQAQGATPHFLIHHRYPQNGGGEDDALLLQSSSTVASDVAKIRQAITNAYGAAGANIEIAVTELNSVSFNPGKQTTSLVNGLFLADSLGFLARTEVNACHWWDFRNGSSGGNNNSANLYGWRPFGDYGVVATGDRGDTPANTPYPVFYAAKLLAQWARGGDTIVAASSNAPLLSVHAAKLANGELALLIVNKDPANDLTAEIALQNFVPGSSSATEYQFGKPQDLANADLSTTSISGVSSSFSQTFPSYSMTVLRLAAPAVVPNAPSNLSATPISVSNIKLSWTDNTSNETGFKIERSLNGTTWSLLKSLGVNATAYSNTGLSAGTRYFYRVRAALSSTTYTAYSNPADATTFSPPAAPAGLSATATASNQIALSWTDNASNETGFRIERSLDGTIWKQITSVAANVTGYSNTALSGETHYFYRVRAYATGLPNSAYSNVAEATTQVSPVAPPSNLSATTVSSSQIRLNWTDNANNEGGFKIERSLNGTTWSALKTLAAGVTTYANTGLSANTRYFYRVRAYHSGVADSKNSNVAEATTLG